MQRVKILLTFDYPIIEVNALTHKSFLKELYEHVKTHAFS